MKIPPLPLVVSATIGIAWVCLYADIFAIGMRVNVLAAVLVSSGAVIFGLAAVLFERLQVPLARAAFFLGVLPALSMAAAFSGGITILEWSGFLFEADTIFGMTLIALSGIIGYVLGERGYERFLAPIFVLGVALLFGIITFYGASGDLLSLPLVGERRSVLLLGLLAFTIAAAGVFYGEGLHRAFSGGVALIVGAMMLVAAVFGPLAQPELRVPLVTTYRIALAALERQPLALVTGLGPHSFSFAWDQHRPLTYNMDGRWDAEIAYGYSLASTHLVTHGFLITLLLGAWLAYAVSLPLKRSIGSSPTVRHMAVRAALCAALVSFWVVWRLPDGFTLMTAAFATALTYGSLAAHSGYKKVPVSRWGLRALCMLIAVAGAGIGLSAYDRHQVVARFDEGVRAIPSLDASEGHLSIRMLEEARAIEPHPQVNRMLSRIYAYQARLETDAAAPASFDVVPQPLAPQADARERVTARAELAVARARETVAENPMDMRASIRLGEALVLLWQVTGSDAAALEARDAFDEARKAANYPVPSLRGAQVALLLRNENEVLSQLATTLRLKPDYDEAHAFRMSVVPGLVMY